MTVVEQAQTAEQPAASAEKIATIRGEDLFQLPDGLYIPPDALKVFLETFEGPLDLLLFLIKKQKLDILDIPVANITRQYMDYMELMKDFQLELAGEYMLMAAMLAEIKSRLLLPRPVSAEADEDDPRAELVRRLQEYERYKQAAEVLDELPRVGREIFTANAELPQLPTTQPEPQVELNELMRAIQKVMQRAKLQERHHIQREALSIRERMTAVLARVRDEQFVDFVRLFEPAEGRLGVVVTLIAILELLKTSAVEIVQAEPYGPIHVKAYSHEQDII